MGRIAERHVRGSSLSKLAILEASAKRFGLHDSAANIETIRVGLNELKSAPVSEKAKLLCELSEDISETRLDLEREHAEIANETVNRRSLRGLITASGIIVAQAINLLTMVFPTEFLRTVSSFSPEAEKNIHMIAAPLILAISIIPLRDFIYALGFDKVKKDIMAALDQVGEALGAGAMEKEEKR